ncbi:MAG TPA: sodium:proton antiporter NhaD [Ferruginibacter sp.]|nr:sodium:proton antiporter NhaD [Ferruginibacter sp.]HMP21026.1 sodium:proton antiporter NhaD [Ferruginibacter sp.]
MTALIITVFIAGYLAIALEYPLKLNKAATALLTGVLCWTILILSTPDKESINEQLLHHFGEIASILFFLLGAMTIVELIDIYDGFAIITGKIKTKSKVKLLWIIAVLTFFLSALLDNLTTAIVMTSLITKILDDKNDRFWFTCMVIIAANAGGAFSPLGDVTTTMLWIGGQITAQNIIVHLFLPSLAVCLVPLLIISNKFRKQKFEAAAPVELSAVNRSEANFILILGITLLLFVPVFKTVTHLPPFMGVLMSLSLLWVTVSFIHFNKPHKERKRYTVTHALQKIDSPSILFFLGILLAVSALQSYGILKQMADFLTASLGNVYLIGTALGIISAIVDNVPLVAAAQGMYDLSSFPTDHDFWKFLALTTGTGGSSIIIGSAAGVAAMGIEKIDFIQYLKKITWIALAGFAAGIAVFMLQTLL